MPPRQPMPDFVFSIRGSSMLLKYPCRLIVFKNCFSCPRGYLDIFKCVLESSRVKPFSPQQKEKVGLRTHGDSLAVRVTGSVINPYDKRGK